jgi:uncharacterized membrane protein YdjX (TVP38/TMEM64 family)
MKKINLKVLLQSVVTAGFIFGAGLVLSMYLKEDVLEYVLMHPVMGVAAFVALAALAVVFPSFTNIMFIPIGVATFGPFWAAVLCIVGWWLGSVAAFAVGRYYEKSLLSRFPSFQNYLYIDKLVTEKNMFWKLIFLRMTFPVDVLSYALALFSKRVTHSMNAITTLIGIAPFAFVFTYAGEMMYKNVVWLTGVLAVVFIVWLIINIKNK